MALTPRKTATPGYPGAEPKKSLLAHFFLLLQTRVTVPVCLCFLLNCAAVQAQAPGTGSPANSGSELAQTESVDPPPCEGKFAPPPVRPSPPPCRGDVAEPPPCAGIVAPNPPAPPPPCAGAPVPKPPPCRGKIAIPQPDNPTLLQQSYREVSLETFYFHASDYLGMRVQLSGTLEKMTGSRLVGDGWYLFRKDPPANSKNQFFACPLTGDIGRFTEGDRVTVQGTVSKREGGPGDVGNGPQTYFVVEIASIASESR